MSLSKAMGCARENPVQQQAQHFYPTPEECTAAFLQEEIEHIRTLGRVWEPAAGEGHIVRVLDSYGLPWAASDIVDRGCPDVTIRNFLDFDEPLGQAVITNPPFGARAPERFVRHALRLGIPYVALFLKATYWNTKERHQLSRDWPLAAVYPLTWRPDFTGDGSPTMMMDWYVWDARRPPIPFKPLSRPAIRGIEDKPDNLPLFEVAR